MLSGQDGDKKTAQNAEGVEYFTYQEAFAHINDRLKKAEFSWAAELAESLAAEFPRDLDAQLAAGQCLLQAGEVEKALLYIERALLLGGNMAPALFLKSRALEHLNQPEKAFGSINQALEIDPDNAEYLEARGSIFMSIADRENAIADFQRVLQINKRSIGALMKLSSIPGYKLSREQMKLMEFRIQSGQLEQQVKGTAHFALAAAYEREGNRDRQFKHLHAGNAIYCKLFKYAPEQFSDQVSEMSELFPAERFAANMPTNTSSQKLIFVVGMPRCGSTLLEQILNSHSQVVTVGENNHMANAIEEFEKHYSFPDMDERSLEALPELAQNYLRYIGDVPSGSVIVDKTLPNYMLSGVIGLAFPNAKFIYAQRNPVATCYGAYKKLFSPGNVTFTYNLEHLAARYRGTIRMVRHWIKVMPERYLVMDYESLVESQQDITRRVLDFCDLPWEESCLNFHENVSAVATASRMQVRQKIYTSAVSEWKQYEDYLKPLVELLSEENGYPIES